MMDKVNFFVSSWKEGRQNSWNNVLQCMLVGRSLIIVYKNASTLSAKPFSKSSNPNVPTCLPFCLGDKLHNCFSMRAQGPHYPVPPFWFCNRVNIFPQYSAFE